MSEPPGAPYGSGQQPPGAGPPATSPRPTATGSGGYVQNNGKAVARVTGIASLVLSWCCGLGLVGIVAVVLGVKARGEIRSGGTQSGDGLALAGIITGAVAIVLGLVVLVAAAIALSTGMGERGPGPGTGTAL